MENEQQYCVVAEDRQTGNRIMLRGPFNKKQAYITKYELNYDRQQRNIYRYFHIAKFPYKPKKR